MLTCTRFSNDTLLAHTLGEHTLSHSVIDLMRPGMCQVLAFEIDFDTVGDHFRAAWHIVECGRASYVTEKFPPQFLLECCVLLSIFVSRFHLSQCRHHALWVDFSP